MAAQRPKPIPAALVPKNKPKTTAGIDAPTPDTALEIHFAIVVPDLRLYNLIRERVIVTSPLRHPVKVYGHVVLEDEKHPAAKLPLYVRQALAESGLVDPDQVGFGVPEQITLGWPKEKP